MLPDFIIAGASRSGTTTLLNLLRNQDRIYMPNSEINYFSFDENYKRGIDWYRNQFDPPPEAEVVGEKSPSYFLKQYHSDEAAMDRIKRDIPSVKLIFTLRNPVDRAYSRYCKHLLEGYIYQAFPRLLEQELQGEFDQDQVTERMKMYIKNNKYYPKLKKIHENFTNDQLLFLTFEDWIDQPRLALKEIYDFIELSEPTTFDIPDDFGRNPGYVPRFPVINYLLKRPFINVQSGQYSRFYGIVQKVRKIPFYRKQKPPIPEEAKEILVRELLDDFQKVKSEFRIDVSSWEEIFSR